MANYNCVFGLVPTIFFDLIIGSLLAAEVVLIRIFKNKLIVKRKMMLEYNEHLNNNAEVQSYCIISYYQLTALIVMVWVMMIHLLETITYILINNDYRKLIWSDNCFYGWSCNWND